MLTVLEAVSIVLAVLLMWLTPGDGVPERFAERPQADRRTPGADGAYGHCLWE